MTRYHTHFDLDSFSAGALRGSFALGSALAAGIANYRATAAADYAHWEADQLRAALRLSELFRARDQMTLGREIDRLRNEYARLYKEGVVRMARKLHK